MQDRAQYLASATSGVNTILGLVYVMLALGQTTAQARGMIRWESVIVAAFGTVGA